MPEKQGRLNAACPRRMSVSPDMHMLTCQGSAFWGFHRPVDAGTDTKSLRDYGNFLIPGLFTMNHLRNIAFLVRPHHPVSMCKSASCRTAGSEDIGATALGKRET